MAWFSLVWSCKGIWFIVRATCVAFGVDVQLLLAVARNWVLVKEANLSSRNISIIPKQEPRENVGTNQQLRGQAA